MKANVVYSKYYNKFNIKIEANLILHRNPLSFTLSSYKFINNNYKSIVALINNRNQLEIKKN